MDSATQMLTRAVELDNQHRYSEAKVCYEEGIEMLLKNLATIADDNVRNQIRLKITTYMKRAEDLKKFILDNKGIGKLIETVKIKNGQIGCSYSTLFSKYVNNDLTKVTIQDAYIRNNHQILNLVRFCELLLKKGKSLANIFLKTGKDVNNFKEQENRLNELKSSLSEHGIAFHIEYSETLHDRDILFDNGWVIKIGRGLDYFKSPKGRTCIGFCDFDLRECHETSIDIYQKS